MWHSLHYTRRCENNGQAKYSCRNANKDNNKNSSEVRQKPRWVIDWNSLGIMSDFIRLMCVHSKCFRRILGKINNRNKSQGSENHHCHLKASGGGAVAATTVTSLAKVDQTSRKGLTFIVNIFIFSWKSVSKSMHINTGLSGKNKGYFAVTTKYLIWLIWRKGSNHCS